jgi:hypothetical protein
MAAGRAAVPAGDWANAEKTQSEKLAKMHATPAARSDLINVHLENEKSWDKTKTAPAWCGGRLVMFREHAAIIGCRPW